MKFGEKLKKIRKHNGLSQEGMAEILFTTQGNYSQYESNSRIPSLNLVVRLIEIFSLDANWLLSSDSDQTVQFCNNNPSDIVAPIKTENCHYKSSDKLLEIERKLQIIISKL